MWIKSGLCNHVQRHIASVAEKQVSYAGERGLEWVCEKCGKHFIVPVMNDHHSVNTLNTNYPPPKDK